MYEFLKNSIESNGESNALKILRFIRYHETTSQTEMVKHFGLSKAAVSEAVQRLITEGYIQEVGMSSASKKGGRRRVLLKFNPLSGFVIGINIKISSAQIALSDLNANIYKRSTVKFKRESSPKNVIPRIIKAADELLKLTPKSTAKLIGIGIGIPGIINYSSGTLVVADTLRGWEGISLSEIFESYFKVPTFIENDVKAMTLAEYLLGVAKGVRNFVLLWIENGIGAGIMVDGRVLRGANSSAGEIGYNELGFLITNKRDFPLLYSGQRDFGDILSEDSIIEAYNRANNGTKVNKLSIKRIHKLVKIEDPVAERIFNEISRLVGIIGIILANTLNPEMIVLGGNVINENTRILDEVSQFLKKDILPEPVQNVKVGLVRNRSDEVLFGAIGLILYELFEPKFPNNTPKLKNHNKADNIKENSIGAINYY